MTKKPKDPYQEGAKDALAAVLKYVDERRGLLERVLEKQKADAKAAPMHSQTAFNAVIATEAKISELARFRQTLEGDT